MTQLSLPNFNSGDSLATTISNLQTLRTNTLSVINGGLADDNVSADGILEVDMGDDANTQLFIGQLFARGFNTSLTVSQVSGLNYQTSAGVAYVYDSTSKKVVRINKGSATAGTATVSRDTYIDIGSDGVIDATEVGNNASPPTLAASHLRLAKIVTNGSTITSVTSLAKTVYIPVISHKLVGLELERVDGNTISVSPGEFYLGATHVQLTASQNIALNTITFLSGSRGAGQWEYIYATDDGSGSATLGVSASSPNTSDTSGGTSGKLLYRSFSGTYYRCIGAVYDSTGPAVRGFTTRGDKFYYQSSPNSHGSLSATVSTIIGFTAEAPAFAEKIDITANLSAAGSVIFSEVTNSGTSFSRANSTWSTHREIPLDGSQQLRYQIADGTPTLAIYVAGFEMTTLRQGGQP